MMPDRRSFLALSGSAIAGVTLWGCSGGPAEAAPERFPVTKTDAQWKTQLGSAAYDVLRHEATERPFSSPLNDEHRSGIFHCKGCDNALYSSKTKFDSGTGWPSFWAPLKGAIGTKTDRTLGMARTEVHCPAHRRPVRDHPRRQQSVVGQPHRGAQPLRGFAPGPCVRRRPAADGETLLHEWRRDDVQAGEGLRF